MIDSALLNRAMSWCVSVGLLMAGLGCGYHTTTDQFMQPYLKGDFSQGAAAAGKLAKNAGRGDKIVYYLEEGAIQRAGGNLDASTAAFDKADALISEFDNEPETKISREAVAAVSNLSTLDYTGYGYDRIMLNTYKALNYLEKGDIESAAVEFRRAYEQQKRSVERNSARIEEAVALKNAKNENDPNEVDISKTVENDDFKKKFSESVQASLADFSNYADYVNPFAEWLQGVFLLTASTSPSDREQAATALRRVAGMIANNEYVLQDLELAEKLPGGTEVPAVTYIIFETGIAPDREEVRIDLPLFLVSKRLPYSGVAFPKLRMKGNHLYGLSATTSTGNFPLSSVASMDAVISREFNNELPTVITKTIIAAATKAAISYAANEAVKKEDQFVQLTVFIGTMVANYALTQADTRCWVTLPKQFEIARIPTPENRQITLQLPHGIKGGPNATVGPLTLVDGSVNFVYIKSIQADSPLIVRQFKVK